MPVPADGLESGWKYLGDGSDSATVGESDVHERVEVRWDNEAWTVRIELGPAQAEVVLRLSPFWKTSQMLLFRDLPTPDLWLGSDGGGRWGEVNGAHRTDLDGVSDIVIPGSVATLLPALRRSAVEVGESWVVPVGVLDPATLGVVASELNLERVGSTQWRLTSDHDDVGEWHFDTDEFGLPSEVTGWAEPISGRTAE